MNRVGTRCARPGPTLAGSVLPDNAANQKGRSSGRRAACRRSVLLCRGPVLYFAGARHQIDSRETGFGTPTPCHPGGWRPRAHRQNPPSGRATPQVPDGGRSSEIPAQSCFKGNRRVDGSEENRGSRSQETGDQGIGGPDRTTGQRRRRSRLGARLAHAPGAQPAARIRAGRQNGGGQSRDPTAR